MGNLIKKPFFTIVVVFFVVAAIVYIESQKPNINRAAQAESPQLEEKTISTATKTTEGKNQDDLEAMKIQGIVKEKGTKYQKAPNFIVIEKWINSEPLKIEQLRGNVVLVDFWTYTCINCIRTLPYLKDWDKKYRDKGLVIVGVHTPEFEFEKKYENVLKAVNDYQLKYAVALDNAYATWNSYQNRYWPHKFLIDVDGYIRYDHIGEGSYDETEKMIQTLLQERMERLNKKNGVSVNITKPKEAIDVDIFNVKTPEIYFGYQFTRGNLGNAESSKPEEVIDYKLPLSISPNNIYLQGKWKNNADNMELTGDEGSIVLIFQAKSVNIVAGSENETSAFVFLDNNVLSEKNKGFDVVLEQNKSTSQINEFKLYNLANAENYGTHVINVNLEGKGFKIYTFTFG